LLLISLFIPGISRYLVPPDADYDHVFAMGIGLETELVTLLERQNAGRILLVLDSCFSGNAGGRTFLDPKLAQRIGQYRAPLSLRHLDLGAGRVILAACRDTEVAIEQHDHGIFTRHFLAILSTARRETVGIPNGYRYSNYWKEYVYRAWRVEPKLRGTYERSWD
jgi:hypothetical protein